VYKYNQLCYEYPVSRLWSGGSYGNPDCFARTDRASNLGGLWLASTNEWVCGRLDLHIEIDGVPLKAADTSFYPGHQVTSFHGNGLSAQKVVFVPFGGASDEGRERRWDEEASGRRKCEATFYTVLHMQAQEGTRPPVNVRVTCDVRWPAVHSREHTKQPERFHIQRRVKQWLEDKAYAEAGGARPSADSGQILWAQSVPFHVDRWDTTLGDPGEVRALCIPEGKAYAGAVGAEAVFSEPGRAMLTYHFELGTGQQLTLPFVLIVGSQGLDDLRRSVATLPGWEEAFAHTVSAYEAVLGTTLLHTPDERINRGMQWAKANTVRVQHRYRLGVGFTNDPPQDIVVVRDCAWYGLGADWLTPHFARSMYHLLSTYAIHEGGKLTEYIHADTGQREDYALNINDDTPLFVVALHHHYAATGDIAFLQSVYVAIRQACDWILFQRREGLVWCSVEGADVWGNATWRNIIPGYNLAGAVTEINALCYWALLSASDLASVLSQPQDAERWKSAADELRSAINAKLATPEGLYLLNMSPAGSNATRTADLVFLLLAGVADPDKSRLILDLLYSPEFHTPYGTHTVGNREAEYHPNFGHGLMGGLWPNLTAWVAYAGRNVYPERLAEMMSSVYALSEPDDPAAGGHLVPGEFPEWFDGEIFESRGMAMSPWMPPTYLWLGVEGLCGVDVGSLSSSTGGLVISHNLPKNWVWISMRNLPYKGGSITVFWHHGTLHTTHAASSPLPQVVYVRDVSDEVAVDPSDGLAVTALERDEGITMLLASTGAFEGAVYFRGNWHSVNLTAGEAALVDWNATVSSSVPRSMPEP
jgi:hypothetical protein